jgi:DNA repair protein RadC
MDYLSIKGWPEEERPRERLLKNGPQSLSDAHLLAVILRTGDGGKSAVDLGIEMINSFEGLAGIENATVGEILKIKGIGSAKAAQVKAAFELGRRLAEEPRRKGPAFLSGKDVFGHYRHRLRDLKKEVFHCVLLDVKNKVLKELRASEGTLTNSLIHPREAFRDAIRESAASVIFVHNHPSGDPSPSQEDIRITERLVEAGDIVGIKVLDHVIIGEENYSSMMEMGYIKRNG